MNYTCKDCNHYRDGEPDIDTALKNAALIAAAPEMLADLEDAAYGMCRHCTSSSERPGGWECRAKDGDCQIQKWLKTIQKARGEE